MSYPELMNWNPMEEEYKRNFSKSSGENPVNDIDPLCLYVRQIPVTLSKDEFHTIMAGRGRRVKSVMINQRGINSGYTFGFANFTSYEDALFAMEELNGTPPHYLNITFGKKKNNTNKDTNENMRSTSRGRGKRIDLEGSNAVSQKLKVTAVASGRKVTVGSPVKKPTHNEMPGFKSPNKAAQITVTPHEMPGFKSDGKATEKDKAAEIAVTPQKSYSQKTDISVALIPNPYFFCFCCGKEGTYACSSCKKPYCSRSCQAADWTTHKNNCRQIKEAAESLIKAYKSHPEALDSSYLSESSNSDPEKYQEYSDVKKLLITSGHFEKVSVVKINNPSKFWVHLKRFSDEFSKMEKELTLLQKNSSLRKVTSMHNLDCCTLFNNKIYRGKIIKEKSPKEVTVHLFDYAETVTVPKNALFFLPEEFRKLPAQAVECKLTDETVKGDMNWNNEEVQSFLLHAEDKIFKAHILRCINNVHEVSLINEDGITLFSILAEEKKTMSSISDKSSVSVVDGTPPSVWSKLKPKTQVTLVSVIPDGDFVWFYLLTSQADYSEVMETENLLQNYSGKDITVCAEEGDFAAGFSMQYKQFYRCVILKRKRSSFVVRYIDYGNEEEITQLCCLSEKLLQKCSFVVKCAKPTSLSHEEFLKFFEAPGALATVVKVSDDVAELAFNFQKEHIMYCHPCYPYVSDNGKSAAESQYSAETNNFRSPSEQVGSPEPLVEFESFDQKKLQLNQKYNVKVVFIDPKLCSSRNVLEVYVQLTEDENKINELFTSLNRYCNSKTTKHNPSIREVVCCKFSDKLWYRGQVKEKINDKYNIFFIDYGNEYLVHPNDIRVLPDTFMTPKFAICVSVSEIKYEDLSECLLSKLVEESWDMKVITGTYPFEVILSQGECSLNSMINNEASNKRSKTALKFQKLPTGVTVGVKVSYEDKKFIYLQQVKDTKALEELCIQLNSLSNLSLPKKPIVGNVYCGLFSDGLWYRVSIEEVVSSDLYSVFYLDYGNHKNVSCSDLRELPEDLFTLPVYCIPVAVQNRQELNISDEEQYAVRVTGMNGEVQAVEFLLHSRKENSLASDTESETSCNLNKTACKSQKELPEDNVDLKIRCEDKKLEDIQDTKVFTKPITEEKVKVSDETAHAVKRYLQKDSVLPKISDFKREKLPIGSESKISICCVENNIFYVHLLSNQARLDDLACKLLKAETLNDLTHLPGVDDVVCAKFSDDIWYRSSVLEISAEKKVLKVLFFDYGNSDMVSLEHIKILPAELCSYPVLCTPVKFNNLEDVEKLLKQDICSFKVTVSGFEGDIHIVDVAADKNVVKSNSEPVVTRNPVYVSSFEKSSLCEKSLCKVTLKTHADNAYFALKSDDTLEMDKLSSLLQEAETEYINNSPSVREILLAKRKDNLWHRCCVENTSKGGESCKIYFVDLGVTEDVKISTLRCLPDFCKSFPLFAIKVFVESEEPITLDKCYDVQVLKENDDGTYSVKVHYQNILSSKGDEELQLKEDHKDSQKFTFDSSKSVPFESGEQDIVIYSVDDEGYLFCAPYIVENIRANSELSEVLTEHCTHKGIPFNNSCEPELGEMVLALYPEDGHWYRGAVIDKSSPSYMIYFVDYGNTEQLDISSLCKMEGQFMTLDMQAHMCALTGFSMAAENVQKVYEEVKNFTFFSHPEPLRAFVKVNDNDILLTIPKITSQLVEKQLVTTSNDD